MAGVRVAAISTVARVMHADDVDGFGEFGILRHGIGYLPVRIITDHLGVRIFGGKRGVEVLIP